MKNSRANLKKRKEAASNDEELATAWEEYSQLERLYVTARSLVNIPDNIQELVFELIKSRFLIFDKIAYHGGELFNTDSDGNRIAENADKFECFTDFLPPAESLRKSKGKGKK